MFSGASVKCVFLYGSNKSFSVVFRISGLAEIKDHSLKTTTFEKKIAMKVLGMYLPYVKRYFYFIYIFFYESINSDSVVFQNDSFAEIKDHSWRTTPFQEKKKSVKVLGLCLPYVKRYFQEHQLYVFFCMAQTNQILLFSGMPVWQRSKITV